jgi:hypothetical protein
MFPFAGITFSLRVKAGSDLEVLKLDPGGPEL